MEFYLRNYGYGVFAHEAAMFEYDQYMRFSANAQVPVSHGGPGFRSGRGRGGHGHMASGGYMNWQQQYLGGGYQGMNWGHYPKGGWPYFY